MLHSVQNKIIFFSAFGILALSSLASADTLEQLTCTSFDSRVQMTIAMNVPPSGDFDDARAVSLELLSRDERSNSILAKFSAADGTLNNSDDMIVAYVGAVAKAADVSASLGIPNLKSVLIDVVDPSEAHWAPVIAQVIYLSDRGGQVSQDFRCSSTSL